ncbi:MULTISPECIES: hypothetical protein [Terrisporobacter]|uniref:Uncharacterized protein n=2 Tax=Terrisporobacter TaxID=1505652 RepID=A0A0B3W098_9FIRM|nr:MULTISPECIES: hypothetical protein [Terrisporobacter]KHS58463.1 hypothetical protein QX51_02905 [Terrisporobacter othiniensis]MCC3669227.1 hypothetical protein [Terrisporobacter mayombei]MCR1824287.1 hypothetical protein [Terrisporobacter muris]MDY3374357.1 hypothetical protein [Terrisporobacter othiniensis]
MKKHTITSVFGIIGILSWTITIFLREISIDNTSINFLLGVMPNLSAAWAFIWLGEIIVNKKNIDFNFKIASAISVLIFLLSIISEVIHDLFLNSSFDIYDLISTVISIIMYLTLLYFNKNHIKIDEQDKQINN